MFYRKFDDILRCSNGWRVWSNSSYIIFLSFFSCFHFEFRYFIMWDLPFLCISTSLKSNFKVCHQIFFKLSIKMNSKKHYIAILLLLCCIVSINTRPPTWHFVLLCLSLLRGTKNTTTECRNFLVLSQNFIYASTFNYKISSLLLSIWHCATIIMLCNLIEEKKNRRKYLKKASSSRHSFITMQNKM